MIQDVLSRGAFAHAARASSTSKGGKNVFLKRYFAPTKALPWYDGFVKHQQELKRRITENDSLQQYCYGFVDFFEGTEGRSNKTFHQVFEFIENGKPLTKFIEELQPLGATAQWDQRVRFSRVMMAGIAALHGQKIVHTDLKPDNLMLIPNAHSPGEYHLKIIDLDWSIFSNQRAPWDGVQGYIGTPMYQSPEHLNGVVPDECSDVFTCGLMLGELLGGGHPFAKASEYADAVKRGGFTPIRVAKPVQKVLNAAFLEDLLNRALNPNPARRPTADELRDALFGRGEAGRDPKPLDGKKEAATGTKGDDAKIDKKVGELTPKDVRSVQLKFDGRTVLTMQIDTMIGKQLLKPISPDAQFASDAQFRIHRSASKEWVVTPVAGVQNETLVNGACLEAPIALRNGMRIAIGNSAKGIEKLPLIVQLV